MTVVYPGSFDPITTGHVNVIERASCMFDRVIVCVAMNKNKHHMFTLEERVKIAKFTLGGIPNVKVISWDGLMTEFALKSRAKALIRGVRSGSDIDKECQMAQINRDLYDGFETIFIPSESKFNHVSSTVVRELMMYMDPLSQDLKKYLNYETAIIINDLLKEKSCEERLKG